MRTLLLGFYFAFVRLGFVFLRFGLFCCDAILRHVVMVG